MHTRCKSQSFGLTTLCRLYTHRILQQYRLLPIRNSYQFRLIFYISRLRHVFTTSKHPTQRFFQKTESYNNTDCCRYVTHINFTLNSIVLGYGITTSKHPTQHFFQNTKKKVRITPKIVPFWNFYFGF